MLTVELEPIIPASKWPQTHPLDCMASGIRRGFIMGMYEGESKSKGKKRNGFNRSNCEQFYIFFYIVPLQHNAFVMSFSYS
jgi:hypothetical protein